MESIQSISDAVNRGCIDGNEMGKLTVLPPSFTGGRRYMIQNYHDAIAICREYGPPDFFVTFTCNPKWLEIVEGILEAGQRPTDRTDIIVTVFNMKLEELLDDIRKGHAFGPCDAVLHTVEFQKRGLPHGHIILWTSTDTLQLTPTLIDSFVSAQIPDPKIDPLGYALVSEHMVHGPCGKYNVSCPCMKNGKCSKFFPKRYQEETCVDADGFAIYKCCQNDLYIDKGGLQLDNKWVVPHNISLLKKYQAHINVEWCNKTTFVNYLFKYVTKGADCSKVYLQRVRNAEDTPYDKETETVNEIKEYLDCRYICEQDTCWRVFGFDIHRHYPSVERMPVHLPNDNFITFSAKAKMDRVLSQEFLRKTMLTEWFIANQLHPEARELTYCQFPSKWRWEAKSRSWEKRCHHRPKICRLGYVHPSAVERFYLRMLLLVVKGALSFTDLRYHNGIQHPTFKEACRSRGLLGDDQEWYNAFDEAAAGATSAQLQNLFVTMILFCEVGDEYAFFEKVWRLLADDIQYQFRDIVGHKNYQMLDSHIRDYLLDELSTIFAKSGSK
ncbi:uncharacterized protein [Miscanthus floridulus]|uniref:uncharacterized protein n=1 Tax=Miscanthus floridulus TaxID=154761 RepID=UPI003458FF33